MGFSSAAVSLLEVSKPKPLGGGGSENSQQLEEEGRAVPGSLETDVHGGATGG